MSIAVASADLDELANLGRLALNTAWFDLCYAPRLTGASKDDLEVWWTLRVIFHDTPNAITFEGSSAFDLLRLAINRSESVPSAPKKAVAKKAAPAPTPPTKKILMRRPK